MKCGIERRIIGVVEQPDIAVFIGYVETLGPEMEVNFCQTGYLASQKSV
jgi:hypothetical protein